MRYVDATLFTRLGRALQIARIMRKRNLKWICDARADEIVKAPELVLCEIFGSGLSKLTIGLESGSKRIVEMMNKGKYHLEALQKMRGNSSAL